MSESPISGVSRDKLNLDPRNPRLVDPDSDQELSQRDCEIRLLNRHDPVSIARSMATFGFFPSDPLIAMPDPRVRESFIVLEGNRRLLAVRLLADQDLRDALEVDDEWYDLSTLAVTNGIEFNELPVQVVEKREDAAPVIGFRHIVGIKRWGAWEKAAFVRDLLASQQASPDKAFETVSKLTGESAPRVRRYLRDYLVVKQAEKDGVSVKPVKAEFGVFTRALNVKGINSYLGTIQPSEIEVSSESGYEAGVEKAQNVVEFLFGGDGKEPVLTDARRLNELGAVLESQEATDHLLRTRNLDESLSLTSAVRSRVLSMLAKSQAALSAAGEDLRSLPELDQPVVVVLQQIRDSAQQLLEGGAVGVSSPSPEGGPAVEDFDLDETDDEED